VEAERAEAAQAERRKTRVRTAVERCVWNEHEGDDAELMLAELDQHLEEEALYATYAAKGSIDAQIARLCEDLGVAAPGPEGSGSPDTASGPTSAPERPPLGEPQEAEADRLRSGEAPRDAARWVVVTFTASARRPGHAAGPRRRSQISNRRRAAVSRACFRTIHR
jgi:hypothetical protein